MEITDFNTNVVRSQRMLIKEVEVLYIKYTIFLWKQTTTKRIKIFHIIRKKGKKQTNQQRKQITWWKIEIKASMKIRTTSLLCRK